MRLFSPPPPPMTWESSLHALTSPLSSTYYRASIIAKPQFAPNPRRFFPLPLLVQIMARANNWRIIITANCYKLTKKNRGPRGGRREKEIRQLDTAIRSSFTRMPNEPRSRVVDYEIELISKIRKWNKSIWKPFQKEIFRFIRRIIREKETRFDRKIWRYF